MKADKILDERGLWIYALQKGHKEKASFVAQGRVLLSIYADSLLIHRAVFEESYSICLASYNLYDLEDVKGRAGLLGGILHFRVEGFYHHFQLPVKAKKFVDFIMEQAV